MTRASVAPKDFAPPTASTGIFNFVRWKIVLSSTSFGNAANCANPARIAPGCAYFAFLNEAVNQLADAYLERKQRETGRMIGHDDYLLEKQKVKAYLADNRVYGVDRNPVAIELAEISLWLNTIYEGHTIPWFGGQLAAGNSLIGARRQVFTKAQLESQNREWLDAVPERVPVGKGRAVVQIWRFIVPAQGMCDYT